MNFSRSPEGQPQQSFQHAASTSPAFSHPSSHSGGSSGHQAAALPQQHQQGNDPQVGPLRPLNSVAIDSFPTHRQAVQPFEIFDWYPKYESCQRYFIEHAQISAPVQALAAFINITLPFQRPIPISPSSPRLSPTPSHHPRPPHQSHTSVSLIPYLRRLVITGLDNPGVLHGFFGDDWAGGVGPLHEQERRNYLFAAKSGGWASVKQAYDMGTYETVPFMRPLEGCLVEEIEGAEKSWSEWLAMEDWMVGPRAPERMEDLGQGGGAGHGHGGGGMERGRGR